MTDPNEPVEESRARWRRYHQLSGAYVVDALPPAEQAAYETHLAECARCRRDVREFREVLSGMKQLIAQPPPPALRASILDRIRDLPQLPPDDDDRR